jgi:phosphate:Na+ symporter
MYPETDAQRALSPEDGEPQAMISALLGGIGLFLLGMVLMTEGLKSAAGGALRDLLARFTGGPLSAFASGAGLTALVQSSSATILTTIGFVSAGLLSFTQAVGVIFGASVGTTSTGWLVAFLGLKYSVSTLALPLVGAGALLRLLARGRTASVGLVIAGLGLIFVGIDTLQLGMQGLSEHIDLDRIPAEGTRAVLILVVVGALMTVVMQSSSAAVATTLTALHAGTIGISQAAVLVIGQNVGTTVTAALASIGASVPARRTALAHILLNSFSGVLALLMLPVYLPLVSRLADELAAGPAGSIAIFHTSFTLIGVAVLLPFTRRYSEAVTRILPDRTPQLTRFLDASVRTMPAVAIEAARRTTREVTGVLVGIVDEALRRGQVSADGRRSLETAHIALEDTRRFLSGVRSAPDLEMDHARHLAVLHATDHLERLIGGLENAPGRALWSGDPTVAGIGSELAVRLAALTRWLHAPEEPIPERELEELSHEVAELRRSQRPVVMARTASGEIDPETGLRLLDAMRWVDRLVYHTWRALHHLTPGSAISGSGSDGIARAGWKGTDVAEPD